MSKISVSISVDSSIVFSDEYIKLKTNRGELSRVFNNFLINYLKIKKIAIPEEISALDDELQQINARKSILLEKKKDIEKKTPILSDREKALGYFIGDDGKKWRERL